MRNDEDDDGWIDRLAKFSTSHLSAHETTAGKTHEDGHEASREKQVRVREEGRTVPCVCDLGARHKNINHGYDLLGRLAHTRPPPGNTCKPLKSSPTHKDDGVYYAGLEKQREHLHGRGVPSVL